MANQPGFKSSASGIVIGSANVAFCSLDGSSSTDAFGVSVGNTSQRPSTPQPGMLRWNTDIVNFEFWNGSGWAVFGGGSTLWKQNGASILSAGIANFINTASVTWTMNANGAQVNISAVASGSGGGTINVGSNSTYDLAIGNLNFINTSTLNVAVQANTGNTANVVFNVNNAIMNATFATINSTTSTINSNMDAANAAIATINTDLGTINSTFSTINTTFSTENTTFGTINSALAQMNSNTTLALDIGLMAYDQANAGLVLARGDAAAIANINSAIIAINANAAVSAQGAVILNVANINFNNSATVNAVVTANGTRQVNVASNVNTAAQYLWTGVQRFSGNLPGTGTINSTPGGITIGAQSLGNTQGLEIFTANAAVDNGWWEIVATNNGILQMRTANDTYGNTAVFFKVVRANANSNIGTITLGNLNDTPETIIDGNLIIQRAPGACSEGEIFAGDQHQWVVINSNTAAGSFNPLVAANDSTIIASVAANAVANTGALTLTTWAANTSGIRITNNQIVIVADRGFGNVNINSSIINVNTATILAGGFDIFQRANLAFVEAGMAYDQANAALLIGQRGIANDVSEVGAIVNINAALSITNATFANINTAETQMNSNITLSAAVGYLAYDQANTALRIARGFASNAGVSSIFEESFVATTNQTTFTLQNILAPANVNYLIVTRNGLVLEPTTHYTLVGQTLTLSSGCAAGDTLDVREFLSANIVGTSYIAVETFTSTTNQNTFTLVNQLSPSQAPYVMVFRNGIEQAPNTHYTLAGQVVTFTSNTILNDLIEVREFINIQTVLPSQILTETFTATTNQNAFTLVNTPSPANNPNYLLVFINGIEQIPTTHYTLAGQVLTFTANCSLNDKIEVREFLGVNVVTLVGGANQQIQFNNNGKLAGMANLTWDYANGTVSITQNAAGAFYGNTSNDALIINTTVGGTTNATIRFSDNGLIKARIGVQMNGSGSFMQFGVSNNYNNGITGGASIDQNGNFSANNFTPTWTAPTINTDWQGAGAPDNNPGYWVDPFQIVHLKGLFQNVAAHNITTALLTTAGYNIANNLPTLTTNWFLSTIAQVSSASQVANQAIPIMLIYYSTGRLGVQTTGAMPATAANITLITVDGLTVSRV